MPVEATSSSTVHTIAALATGHSPAGVAVIRISGPEAIPAIQALFKGKKDPLKNPRLICYGAILDHKGGDVIDHGLCVYMPNPYSFTGEDVVELHTHGSPLIAKRVLQSLFAFGITPAEAGEFTKRAFLNGKIDLVQAEAIGELISATSEAALKVASEHLAGKLSEFIDSVAEPLRDLLAEIEASLDFPEEDIDPAQVSQMQTVLTDTSSKLQELLDSFRYGQIMREGYKVLLCGPPNAGKSSLLNTLLGRERAIVTDISGTTRDLIEEECSIKNYRFILCDSAGITETDDRVEKLGVELSLQRIPWADLVLFIIDGSEDYPELTQMTQLIGEKAKNVWMITNKVDLNSAAIEKYFCDGTICRQNFYLSVTTGDGLSALKDALVTEVENSTQDHSHASNVLTQARQASLVERAIKHLQQGVELFSQSTPLEILSEEIRLSLKSLEEIVGKTYTEDILGRIFSKFCIGK